MMLSIYTQDKTKLIKYKDKIVIKPFLTGKQFTLFHGKDELGTYKSKERAIEVLKEIIELIKEFHRFTNEEGKIVLAFPSTGEVYEMPKE